MNIILRHHKSAVVKNNSLESKTPFSVLNALTHFMPLVSFYTAWKHQKTSGFLMFSGGIERDQWHEMGYNLLGNYFFLSQKYYLLNLNDTWI